MAYIICAFSVIYFLVVYFSHYSIIERFNVTKYVDSEGNKIKQKNKDKNKKYGYDTYKVNSLCGCGGVWICTVADQDGRRSCCFEPNTEIFFTENDVIKALNKIKRMEDPKKLNKWKRRDWFNA